jgi:hypothetical protein
VTEPIYERASRLLEAKLGDELVALDAEAGNCFGFNSVATRVWELLLNPKTFTVLRETLVAEYDVGVEQCTDELHGLLDNLMKKGLVRVQVSRARRHTAAPES